MMTYKHIIVHIDSRKSCAARLELAIALARRFDANLTGLYVDSGLMLPAFVDAPMPGQLLESLEQDRLTQVTEAREGFNRHTEQAGVRGEWRIAKGSVADSISLHARYADLLIVGQDDEASQGMGLGGLPDAMVLECARPVLIVPYIGAPTTAGKRVLVAWNGSREAVRAVNDAMPFLQCAEEVQVLSVNPRNSERTDVDLPGAEICLHLARHGVKAEAQQVTTSDIDVGNVLLSRAAGNQIDLIVMGAYGHSRFRELVLGGATKELLKHMTVPILMAH